MGICLGLQVLFDHSEENNGTKCLGLLQGQVRHLNAAIPKKNEYKIPHMGWNNVKQIADHPLWNRIADNEYFYFVHSYHIVPDDEGQRAGSTEYGVTFGCAAAAGYIFCGAISS